MTRREPGKDELRTSSTACASRAPLAGHDLGQTVGGQGPRGRRPGGDGGHGRDDPARRPASRARAATVVKVAKPRQDPRFDVPVVGAGHARRDARGGRGRPGGGGGADAAHRQGRRSWPPPTRPGSRSGACAREAEAAVTARVAVVGVGALGQHHARVYAGAARGELVGRLRRRPARAREVAARHGCPAFAAPAATWSTAADAVSVAVPTVDHHRVARALLEAGKDVLVEKPIAATLAEADDLDRGWPARRGRVLQVGHVERFNPAVDVLRADVREPRFIEVHRLAPFSPAQPGHRRGARPDDPRPRPRPQPRRVGGGPGRRRRASRS